MTTVNKAEIPDIVVGRLPRYLRALKNLRETKKLQIPPG